MTEVRFIIPGRISGKGRARATQIGGFVRLYTPSKTRAEEAMIATLGKAAVQRAGGKKLEGALALDIVIVQQPPESWSKKKRQQANWIVSGFDLDNAIKEISDALNGIAYEDDRQISKISAERVWRMCGEERVEVKITTLE